MFTTLHCAGKDGKPGPAQYIGETERYMDICFREHQSNVKLPNSDMYSSAIRQHINETDHCFRTEDVTFLKNDANWHVRGIKEAVYVCSLQPTLNRDGGRHELPHLYNDLLKTHIRPPSDPRPLNPGSPSNPRTLNGLRSRGQPPGTPNRQCILDFLARHPNNPQAMPIPTAPHLLPCRRPGRSPKQKPQAQTQPVATGDLTSQTSCPTDPS
jgi:hypothetical protein